MNRNLMHSNHSMSKPKRCRPDGPNAKSRNTNITTTTAAAAVGKAEGEFSSCGSTRRRQRQTQTQTQMSMNNNSPHRQEQKRKRERQRRRRRWTRAPTSPMNLGAATATAMLLLLSSSGSSCSCASATTVNSHNNSPHGRSGAAHKKKQQEQQGMSPNPSSTTSRRNLPQHRVRSTRRMVDYGLNHPWNEFSNLHGIHYDMNDGFTEIRDGMDFPFMSTTNVHVHDASKNGENMEEEKEEGGGGGEEEEDAEAAWQRQRQRQRQRRILRNKVLTEFLPMSQMRSWSAQSTIIANTETLMPERNGSTSTSTTASDDTPPNTDNTHENIRIKASIIEHDSSGYAYLSSNERSILLSSIIQPMLNTWSKALKVVPIQPMTPLTIDSYQLYDGKTCGPGMDSGLPSVLVPLDHMVDGIVDTDLMVYVSVGFHGRGASRRRRRRQRDDDYDRRRAQQVQAQVQAQTQDGNHGDLRKEDSTTTTSSSVEHTSLQGQDSLVSSPFFTKLRGQHTNYTSYGNNQAEEYIDTDIDTDTDAYIDEESLNDHTDAVPTCSGSYLASATYCSTDQYDRPIAGMLHLCIGPDFFIDVSQKELYRRTVLHELGHVLGFNAQSLAHFRNETTGEPLTPRDGNGDVVDRWVQCAGPVGGDSESQDENGDEDVIVSETTGLGDEDNSGTAEDLELDSGEDTITDTGLLHGEGERYLRNRRPDSRSRNRRRAFIPLPSKDILQFRNDVRGGVRVAQVVTPTVKQVARNHFDCQTLDGAELESGLSTSDVPMGESGSGSGSEHSSVTDPDMESSIYDVEVDMDIIMNENTDTEDEPNNEDETIDNSYMVEECISGHWERRLFKADIMNPIMDSVSSTSHISTLTLAYFMDSGWYKVDTSRSAEPDIWGRAAGCDFVNENCIFEEGLVSGIKKKFFCSDHSNSNKLKSLDLGMSTIDGCTDDMMGKATCSIVQYDSPLPFPYQHFEGESSVGGGDAYLDYCPTYEIVNHGMCTDDYFKISRMEEMGSTSRCLTGQIDKKKNAALCIPVACVVEDRSLHVRVDELWKPCRYEGEVIESFYDGGDYVFCPDPVQTCPSFYCPHNCLFDEGAGICDYASGNCTCVDGIGGDSCGSSFDFDSLVEVSTHTSQNYLLNSAGLENEEKDIFDQAARMFIQMNLGEVIGFVTFSFLIVGGCFVVVSSIVKIVKDRRVLPTFVPRFWRKDWRVNTAFPVPYIGDTGRSTNKQKMVATVLHNMRVEDAMSDCFDTHENHNVHDELNATHDQQYSYDRERVFYRSEMPPLPGVGRVVSVIGARFVNDSIVPNDHDDNMTLAGTADDTRSSGMYELNSDHGTEGYAVEDRDHAIEEETLFPEPSLPATLIRRRVNIPRPYP